MPRVTKKEKIDDFINEKDEQEKKAVSKKSSKVSSKSVKSTKETASAKSVTTKRATATKKTSATKTQSKTEVKANTETEAKVKTTAKPSTKEKAETKTKKASSKTKKASSTTTKKKSSSKSKVTPVKSILSRTRNRKKTDDITSSTVLEYYDLPYRYNETIVKILAQTPTILFVYWDISDTDRANFIEKYGENFFNTTKPVLLIHNKTKNYSFEVEINDFANSWYLRMQEPDCEYEIELGRKSIENFDNYVYVTSSNNLVIPNDHILFESSDFKNVKFRNVKTGHLEQKDFGSLRLLTDVGNIYNKKHKVYRFYEDLYKNEILEDNKTFSSLISGNPTSGMF